jgi:TonB family protein
VIPRAFAALVCLSSEIANAAEDIQPIFNEEIKVARLEEMEYPLAARLKVVEGVVVVQVTVNANGQVYSANAVSGPKLLVANAVENARKWIFRPSARRQAIIVYDFKIEGLCVAPCKSQFVFRPPNMIVIRIGQPLIEE